MLTGTFYTLARLVGQARQVEQVEVRSKCMGLNGEYIGYRLLVECDEQGCNVSCTYFCGQSDASNKKG